MPSPVYLDPHVIAGYAKAVGFAGEDLVTITAIAMAESRGNTNAHNAVPPDDSYGLWQINMRGQMGPDRRAKLGIGNNEQLYDPGVNARAAKMIKDGQGFDAWTVYKTGAYRTQLGNDQVGARAAAAHPTAPGEPIPGVNLDPNRTGGPGTIGGDVLGAAGDAAGNLLTSALTAVFEGIVNMLKPVTLRVAGFVGGGALIVVALVLYTKGQAAKDVMKVVKP